MGGPNRAQTGLGKYQETDTELVDIESRIHIELTEYEKRRTELLSTLCVKLRELCQVRDIFRSKGNGLDDSTIKRMKNVIRFAKELLFQMQEEIVVLNDKIAHGGDDEKQILLEQLMRIEAAHNQFRDEIKIIGEQIEKRQEEIDDLSANNGEFTPSLSNDAHDKLKVIYKAEVSFLHNFYNTIFKLTDEYLQTIIELSTTKDQMLQDLLNKFTDDQLDLHSYTQQKQDFLDSFNERIKTINDHFALLKPLVIGKWAGLTPHSMVVECQNTKIEILLHLIHLRIIDKKEVSALTKQSHDKEDKLKDPSVVDQVIVDLHAHRSMQKSTTFQLLNDITQLPQAMFQIRSRLEAAAKDHTLRSQDHLSKVEGEYHALDQFLLTEFKTPAEVEKTEEKILREKRKEKPRSIPATPLTREQLKALNIDSTTRERSNSTVSEDSENPDEENRKSKGPK